MARVVARVVVFLGSAALGLLVAALLLTDVQLSVWGFLTAVLVFAVAQSVLSPLTSRLIEKYASVLTSGIGLISTFVALWLAALLSGGLRISGVATWALATLIVWLVTSVATVALPYLFKDHRDERRRGRN